MNEFIKNNWYLIVLILLILLIIIKIFCILNNKKKFEFSNDWSLLLLIVLILLITIIRMLNNKKKFELFSNKKLSIDDAVELKQKKLIKDELDIIKKTNNLSAIHKFLFKKFKNSKTQINKINIPIYFINLNTSKERYKFMKKQQKIYNLNMTRIEGIDGNKLTNEINLTNDKKIFIKYNFNNENNSKYEYACTLSHLKAIYNSYINGDEISIICEDDVSLSLHPYWDVNIDQIINDAPDNWNIISLYWSFEKEIKINSKYMKFNLPNHHWYGSVMYIINRKGMTNVLRDILLENEINFRSNKSYNYHNFIQADYLIYHRAINTYAYTKNNLVYTYNSDIGMDSTIHNSHTDYHLEKSFEIIRNFINNKFSDNKID